MCQVESCLQDVHLCIASCWNEATSGCRPAVSSRSQLLGRHVTFTYDPVCGRQLVVLQEFSASTPAEQPSLARDSSIAGTMDSLARGNTTYKTVGETLCSLDEADLSNLQRDALLKKLSRHLGKGQETGAAPS